MKRAFSNLIAMLPLLSAAALALSCGGPSGDRQYVLGEVMEVEGRQGVAADSSFYYVSGSTAIYKYDRDGHLLMQTVSPFDSLALEANHFGDIDVYGDEIFTGAETFLDGVGHNIQVAVYDAATLGYKYSIDWLAESGQVEVCGLAVDREHGRVWMADWVQGHELYCYDIATRSYLGKVRLDPAPHLQQGIFCLSDGRMVISADDGDADKDEPDHLYVCELYPGGRDLVAGSSDGEPAVVPVSLFREMGDFRRAGEIEGLCFDPLDGALMVLSNRGSRIVLGMVKGFYDGYDREIHEIHIYR